MLKFLCPRTHCFRKDKPEWYLKLNPNGKVPALQHGSTVMFESSATLRWHEISKPISCKGFCSFCNFQQCLNCSATNPNPGSARFVFVRTRPLVWDGGRWGSSPYRPTPTQTWVVVKIMVPFCVPAILRHLLLSVPNRDLNFDNYPLEPEPQLQRIGARHQNHLHASNRYNP